MDWHGFKLDFTRKSEVSRLSLVLRKTIDYFRMTSEYSFVVSEHDHEPGGCKLNKSLRSRNCVSSRHWSSPLTHQDAARIAQGL